MSQSNRGPRAFVAGEALAAYRRVKLDSTAGQVVYADADEKAVGFTLAAAGSGEQIAVECETVKLTASAAVAAHASIYAVADGKVDDAGAGSGSAAIGVALEAALANGDIIECVMNTVVA